MSGIDKRIEKLKKENDALKLQKEQQEEEQSELVKEENSLNQEELKKFIADYLEVMFTYGSNAERNKALRPFASDKYFEFID